tara:strand:+ start:301 stop:669 length:369 start_codon:yes stop_codon:yes gene_type:complete
MEYKSTAVKIVAELFERAENQADTIDSQRENIIKLNKQLEDKYSTDTHILMTKDAVVALADKFDELSDEFKNLGGLLEDMSSTAESIVSDAEYNDASRHGDWATGYADELRILLNKETEEVE